MGDIEFGESIVVKLKKGEHIHMLSLLKINWKFKLDYLSGQFLTLQI